MINIRKSGIQHIISIVVIFGFYTKVNAAILDFGSYTADTSTGLEWLDITMTSARTYADISSQLGSGGEFEGWRYASAAEVAGFFDSFGGVSAYYNSGWSMQNNGLFVSIPLQTCQ